MSTDVPRFGQRSDPAAAPDCPRHLGVRAVDYCKRCHRPMCVQCRVPVEVGAICVDCAKQNRLRRTTRTPVVTYGIIAACVALYLVGMVSHSAEQAFVFAPVLGYFQPWRFLTTAFLHASVLHILFNMLALYWVGRSIEPVLGHWRFAVLYLLSAIGGSAAVLAWCLISPSAWTMATVGASGAVFGLFAAVFVLQRMSGADTTSVLVLLGINLVYGFMQSNISWQAHVGGLITGLVVTWVFARLARPRQGVTLRRQEQWAGAASAGMAVALIAVIAGLYALLLA